MISYYALGLVSEMAAAARKKEPTTNRYRIKTRLAHVRWDCNKAKHMLQWQPTRAVAGWLDDGFSRACKRALKTGGANEIKRDRDYRCGLPASASLLALASVAVRSQTLPDYRLHPGDKVIIGVYDDPKLLPQEMTVAPDGRISYPMVGELMAGGKTVEQVRLELQSQAQEIHRPIRSRR